MRGEVLIWGASFLTLAAAICQVFTHIGQINDTTVPRHLWILKVDTSGLESRLTSTNSGSSFSGLYSTTTNNPALGSSGGLKNAYRWGPLGQCGFVDGSNVVCDQPEFGQRFEPFNTLLADTPQQYKMAVSNAIPSSRFKNNYGSTLSVAAFWTVFLGACLALVAFCVGLIPSKLTYAVAAVLTVLAWIGLAIGSAIWTALFIQLRNNVPGIAIQIGSGFILIWVSTGLLTLAIVPYLIGACTYERYDVY